MQLQLRPYQQRAIAEISESLSKGQRTLFQLPTGGGKTIVSAEAADQAIKQGHQVLFMAHRRELIEQAADKIGRYSNCPVGVIQGGIKPDYDAPLQVASGQSLINRLDKISPSLIIADEAHHSINGCQKQILDHYSKSSLLGVTATPRRLDRLPFDSHYDVLIKGPTVKRLISDGYLCDYQLYAASELMKEGGMRGGDYDAADLAEANDAIKLSGNLLETYNQYCPNASCIVFAINVDHSMAIADQYNSAGIPASHLDGNTPKSVRKQVLQQFAAGEIKIVSNVNLFDEGFDLPSLDAVQIARPTKSLTKWLQMLGRALRPAPGKSHAVFLDHTTNHQRLGTPKSSRRWSLTPPKRKPAPAPPEVIPDEPKEQKQIVEVSADFELVLEVPEPPSENADPKAWKQYLTNLMTYQQGRGYKKGWVAYPLIEARAPLDVFKLAAKRLGYQPGWAWHRWKEAQGQTALDVSA